MLAACPALGFQQRLFLKISLESSGSAFNHQCSLVPYFFWGRGKPRLWRMAEKSPTWRDFQLRHRNRCSGSLLTPNKKQSIWVDVRNSSPRPSNLQRGPTVYREPLSLSAICIQCNSCPATPWFQSTCYFSTKSTITDFVSGLEV